MRRDGYCGRSTENGKRDITACLYATISQVTGSGEKSTSYSELGERVP